MYILISIFAFSFLGTVCMIGYKLVVLEKRSILGISGRTSPSFNQHDHSLEHRLGTFLRTYARQYAEKGFFWIKTVCIPVLVRFTKITTEFITYVIKYVGVTVSHRVHSLRNENVPRNGASSFFLKDITEHKKNLKKDERV